MRLMILLWLAGCHTMALAQGTDFTDFRSKRESFARIYDKEIRSELASFAIGGIEESIGKAPMKRLPAVQYGNDFISFDSANISVTIRAGIFMASKHKMGYEGKFLTRIDNRPYYGTYSKIPLTTVAAVTVIINKDTIPIPVAAYSDLYNPQFTFSDATGAISTQDAIYLSLDKRRIYIYMLNKDNNGSYEVTWVIQDKGYLRRVLDFGFTQ